MTVAKFIEKAIEGGWMELSIHDAYRVDASGIVYEIGDANHEIGIAEILLDPAAWQAVGKVEGWSNAVPFDPDFNTREGWLENMHRIIDHLAEGGTIESYLAGL